jgi:hypothetical protein
MLTHGGIDRGRQIGAGSWVHRTISAALIIAATAVCSSPVHPEILPDLSGTWAEQQILSEFAALPLVGEVARTSTIVLRVTIEQNGSALTQRWTYCATEIDNGSAIASTVIPDAFLVSLGEVAAEAALDASVSPARFVQPWTTEVRGATLGDPERDPLPTRADDARVVDQDGDGKPGLTARVSALGIFGGDVYIVQRVRTRLIGTLVSPDRIEGLVEWSTEQVTLGASNPLFLGTLPSRPDPAVESSFFVLARVDPAWTCAEILARRAELFDVPGPT